MEKVTAAELQRQFGRLRNLAQRKPVMVTSHGRDDVVLLSAHEYARLKSFEQVAMHVSELPEDVVAELGSVAIPAEAEQFNDELQP